MDIHTIIGIKIKSRRKELGISGANLAEKLNLSQQQVSRYENGINKIPINHLIDIAKALNCSIEWFFYDCSAPREMKKRFTENEKRF